MMVDMTVELRAAMLVDMKVVALVEQLDASKAHKLVSLSAVELGWKKAFQLVDQMAG
jgi:hypothetical protein